MVRRVGAQRQFSGLARGLKVAAFARGDACDAPDVDARRVHETRFAKRDGVTHQAPGTVVQAEPGIGQAQVVFGHGLLGKVARLTRHAVRFVQAAHAHRKVFVALVARAERPCQAAAVTRLLRQCHGLLGQRAVLGGVGFVQLHGC